MVRTAIVGLALATSTAALAQWDFKVITDPMTDASRGISVLKGEGGALVVKCDENGPGSLYLTFISDQYIGALGNNRVRDIKVRFDGGAVQTIKATHDKSIIALFNLRPTTVGGQFLRQVWESRKLVVQATSYDYESRVMVFDTTGANDMIAKAAQTCGDTNWTVPPSD